MEQGFTPMPESTALLISTDSSLAASCHSVVHAIANLQVVVVDDIKEAEVHLQGEEVSLLLAHLTHKEQTAEVFRLLQAIAGQKRPIATLVIGEEHLAEQGLVLLRQGAADYLTRPLDLGRLAYLADTLTVRARYAARPPVPAPARVQQAGAAEPFYYLPATPMARMMEQVRVVAPQETTVLLTGETGTGKTRLARLIQELSPRSDQPFLVINCGALAPNLIESEMFGHVKGAYTGADRDRTGKFQEVGRGTLLLDEIDSLPLMVQSKLLRAVEERVFEPVGSNKTLPVRARLIVASNRLLDKEVEAGRFRSDLYYRLNVVGFHLPPLRERRSVIPHLAAHFIADFAARNSRPVRGITVAALRALGEYSWPGNLRELRNVIERAVALCPDPEIDLDDLPEVIRALVPRVAPLTSLPAESLDAEPASATLDVARGEAEVSRITAALRKHGNNRLRAAAELGISRMTLYKKLHKYGLMGT